MNARPPRERLCTAILEAVQRVSRRHPNIEMNDVCAAIGIAAGTLVGVGVPHGLPEADMVLGIAYAQGVKSVRQRNAS